MQKTVKDFITELPWRIRNIKTSTEKINRQRENEVWGRINWPETLQRRYNKNYGDKTVFVCDQTDKNFNIRENIVLKKLLSIIYDIIVTDLEGSRQITSSWMNGWAAALWLTAWRISINETYI